MSHSTRAVATWSGLAGGSWSAARTVVMSAAAFISDARACAMVGRAAGSAASMLTRIGASGPVTVGGRIWPAATMCSRASVLSPKPKGGSPSTAV